MEYLKDFLPNFLNQIGGLLPGVLGAIAVLFIGWLIARGLSGLVRRLLGKTDLDNRLFKGAKSSISPERFLSKLVYYLIMLMVLMITLEMLGVENVLDPIKELVRDFFSAIPNIVKAGIIGFAGYIIATIAADFIGMASGALTRFSERFGLSSDIDLPKLVRQVVFILVFFPLLVQALDALGIDAISGPAKMILNSFFEAIPKIIVAAIILTVFFYAGRFVTGILESILKNLGMDNMTSRMGLTSIIGQNQSLASLISSVAFFFLMFIGIIQAADKLEMGQLTTTLQSLMDLTGNIFLGLLIMALGNFIANIAARAVQDDFLSSVARIAVLGLFLAIALRTMGIANDIVNLAFGLTLGAVAVAVALSFGLGGREAAGKQMEHILKRFRK